MLEIKLGTVLDAKLAGKVISGLWLANENLATPGMKLLKRHRFTCQGCGFRTEPSDDVAHGWMVPVDQTHAGLVVTSESRGTCLCPICACTLASNWSVRPPLGKNASPPGMLIRLPHMSQVEVNRLAIHLVSINAARKLSKQSSIEAAAINIDNAFVSLNDDLAGSLPIYRSKEDANFVRALSMLPNELYSFRDQIISPIRWWPVLDFWRPQGVHWMKHTYLSKNSET